MYFSLRKFIVGILVSRQLSFKQLFGTHAPMLWLCNLQHVNFKVAVIICIKPENENNMENGKWQVFMD